MLRNDIFSVFRVSVFKVLVVHQVISERFTVICVCDGQLIRLLIGI